MSAAIQKLDANLYLADETAWLKTMAAHIEAGRFDDVDYLHLQEFLTDMARRDRREVESRLVTILAHMLKWNFQKDRRSTSWATTLETQRQELMSFLESKSLRKHAEAELQSAYEGV